jgi:hypothetical protein
MTTTTTALVANPNRRLILTLYRSMLRWCNDVNPKLPLADFIEYNGRDIVHAGSLKEFVRESFRRDQKGNPQDRITEAITALRHLNELRPVLDDWEETNNFEELLGILANDDGTDDEPLDESWTEQLINAVDWLPSIEQSQPSSSSDETTVDTTFPLFPLQGPLYSSTGPMPLFTSIQDIPIPGMEISLTIFEPRYRKLYQDILTSGTKKFVVPFCHPTHSAKWATHGLLYEVVHVKEVADETNGVIQYMANHLVTKPILIKSVLNPQVWETQETYLQIKGHVVKDDFVTDVEPLELILQDWIDTTNNHPLAIRAMGGLRAEGIWGFVNVWNNYLQQELLNLQVQIAAEAQQQGVVVATDEEATKRPQPHRPRLLSLHLDIALLVPMLLQLDNEKMEYLLEVVDKERTYLNDKARIATKETKV